MTYKATTINGEPKLELVNPHHETGNKDCIEWHCWNNFKKDNPPFPYIGPALPDGTILDESEVEIGWQCQVLTKNGLYKWVPIPKHMEESALQDANRKRTPTRQVATLKAKEPEGCENCDGSGWNGIYKCYCRGANEDYTTTDVLIGDLVMVAKDKDEYKNGNFSTEMQIVGEDSHCWILRCGSWCENQSVTMPKHYCVKLASNSEEGEQDLWEEILTRLHFDKPFHRTMKDSVIKEFTTKYKITRL